MAEVVKDNEKIGILNLADYQAFYIAEKSFESIRRWRDRGQPPEDHPLFEILEPLVDFIDQKHWTVFVTNVKDFLQEICDHDYSTKREFMEIGKVKNGEDVYEEYWICDKCGHVGDKVT